MQGGENIQDIPDRKRKPTPGLLLVCLVCVFAVISAGCGGDYVPNRDIIVIKLHPDGTTAWTQLIDSGRDDAAYDLIETPGGDLVIAGGKVLERIGNPHPRLIRLSPEGSVLCDRVLDNMSGELISVARIQNGDYAAAMHHGEILWFDPDGSYLWSNSTGMQEIRSITGTMDGGLIIGGGSGGTHPVRLNSRVSQRRNGILAAAVCQRECHDTGLHPKINSSRTG